MAGHIAARQHEARVTGVDKIRQSPRIVKIAAKLNAAIAPDNSKFPLFTPSFLLSQSSVHLLVLVSPVMSRVEDLVFLSS